MVLIHVLFVFLIMWVVVSIVIYVCHIHILLSVGV